MRADAHAPPKLICVDGLKTVRFPSPATPIEP